MWKDVPLFSRLAEASWDKMISLQRDLTSLSDEFLIKVG